MHNVRRFLQDAVFEQSQEARVRAAAEGNMRPEDVVPLYRKRTTIDTSGRETETQTRYVRTVDEEIQIVCIRSFSVA